MFVLEATKDGELRGQLVIASIGIEFGAGKFFVHDTQVDVVIQIASIDDHLLQFPSVRNVGNGLSKFVRSALEQSVDVLTFLTTMGDPVFAQLDQFRQIIKLRLLHDSCDRSID